MSYVKRCYDKEPINTVILPQKQVLTTPEEFDHCIKKTDTPLVVNLKASPTFLRVCG